MAFTALRTASQLWYSALYTFTAFLLLFAMLAARFRRGPERAFWFGFAVFGWAFFLMGLGPWMNPISRSRRTVGCGGLNPNLLTSKVILFLVAHLRKDTNNLGEINAITENTIGIAHLLTTLILAVVGGIIAALLRRRPRSTTSLKSLAILAGLGLIAAVAASVYSTRPRDPFFPDSAFVMNKAHSDLIVNWYTKQLDAMDEPSLQTLSRRDRDATVYRLLWIPSFHHPVQRADRPQGRGCSTRRQGPRRPGRV